MTVTPYTDPQIDPTVAQPWPTQTILKITDLQTQVNNLTAIVVAILPVVSRHTEQIADANAYAADLDRRLRITDCDLRDAQSAIRNLQS